MTTFRLHGYSLISARLVVELLELRSPASMREGSICAHEAHTSHCSSWKLYSRRESSLLCGKKEFFGCQSWRR